MIMGDRLAPQFTPSHLRSLGPAAAREKEEAGRQEVMPGGGREGQHHDPGENHA